MAATPLKLAAKPSFLLPNAPNSIPHKTLHNHGTEVSANRHSNARKSQKKKCPQSGCKRNRKTLLLPLEHTKFAGQTPKSIPRKKLHDRRTKISANRDINAKEKMAYHYHNLKTLVLPPNCTKIRRSNTKMNPVESSTQLRN